MVQDASFSAQGIWSYPLGATLGIQLITGENHVAKLGMVPGTKMTTGTNGGGTSWRARHGELAQVMGARAGVTRDRDTGVIYQEGHGDYCERNLE